MSKKVQEATAVAVKEVDEEEKEVEQEDAQISDAALDEIGQDDFAIPAEDGEDGEFEEEEETEEVHDEGDGWGDI